MSGDYVLAGMRVRAELPFPELAPWHGGDRTADLVISIGAPQPDLEAAHWLSPMLAILADRTAFLTIPAVGDFHVRDGREVIITPRVDTASAELRVFLLGTVFGLVCHQRGLFPLHGSCVGWNGRAIVFAGASGAGKSTMAALLLREGGQLLSDDVCVVDVHASGGPRIVPSFPRLKLWRDSLEHLGVSTATLERNRPAQEKYHWRIEDDAQPAALPLDTVYVLERAIAGRPTGILPILEGVPRTAALHGQIYRRDAGQALRQGPRLFADAGTLASHVPVKRLVRTFDENDAWSPRHVLEDIVACPA